jgi:magnesium and cobalt exporter, CNNM family
MAVTTAQFWYLLLFFVCLVLSAFFSSSETAFTSLQRYRLEHMLNTKVRGAGRVARLINKPERLLSTILLGNNLVNTAAAALATALVTSWVGPEWGVLVATLSVTIILLVFTETTPKMIATNHAERLSTINARFIEIIGWALTPFVWILEEIASSLSKFFGGTPATKSLASEAEIRTMINVGHKEGTFEESQAEMLQNVFEFGGRPVREVMIPRLEVSWVEDNITVTEFYRIYEEKPYSRFPVFQESQDNVVGILSIKDIIMAMAKGTVNGETLIGELIRPPFYTPETKHINELFNEMRDQGAQMAIVVDEYGGTAGIVSLGGLVAEIVGPVGDELGGVEKEYEIINENTFQIDAGMQIDEANEEMGLNLPEGDYETVAGFVLSLLGRIPRQNEKIKYQNMKLVVTSMRGVKIEEIVLTKIKPKKADDEENAFQKPDDTTPAG